MSRAYSTRFIRRSDILQRRKSLRYIRVPAVLHVNKESRNEAKRFYTLADLGSDGVYCFNTDRDTLQIVFPRCPDPIEIPRLDAFEKALPGTLQRILKVELIGDKSDADFWYASVTMRLRNHKSVASGGRLDTNLHLIDCLLRLPKLQELVVSFNYLQCWKKDLIATMESSLQQIFEASKFTFFSGNAPVVTVREVPRH